MPEMNGWQMAEKIAEDSDTPNTPIILLSSAGLGRADPERIEALHVISILPKPVKQFELWDAVNLALGMSPSDKEHLVAPSPPVSSLELLVAEDSEMNQRLLGRLLEMKGHQATFVDDGQAAVDRYESGVFDVILMDVEMPVMGGLEATRAIRRKEQSTGAHTPIIALTAHAMKGDRERCLEAGMDAYVSKPIQAEDLFRTIDQLAASAGDLSMADSRDCPVLRDL
jgi:CheY-like chemotaxis protein